MFFPVSWFPTPTPTTPHTPVSCVYRSLNTPTPSHLVTISTNPNPFLPFSHSFAPYPSTHLYTFPAGNAPPTQGNPTLPTLPRPMLPIAAHLFPRPQRMLSASGTLASPACPPRRAGSCEAGVGGEGEAVRPRMGGEEMAMGDEKVVTHRRRRMRMRIIWTTSGMERWVERRCLIWREGNNQRGNMKQKRGSRLHDMMKGRRDISQTLRFTLASRSPLGLCRIDYIRI